MNLNDYYESLLRREKEFPAELHAGWDAIVQEIAAILDAEEDDL